MSLVVARSNGALRRTDRPLLEARRTFREALLPAGATRMTRLGHGRL